LLLIGGRLSTLDPMLLLARAVDLIDAFTVIDPVLGGRAAAKRAFDARTLQMRAYARSYRILFPRGLLRIIFFGNATFMAMLGVRSAPSAEQRRAMLRLNREDPERDIHCLVMVDEAGTSKVRLSVPCVRAQTGGDALQFILSTATTASCSSSSWSPGRASTACTARCAAVTLQADALSRAPRGAQVCQPRHERRDEHFCQGGARAHVPRRGAPEPAPQLPPAGLGGGDVEEFP